MTHERYLAGQRPDGSPWYFRLLPLPPGAEPEAEPVTAVCALIEHEGRILAVQNPRGLDVPGGHVEPGESLSDALRREVSEEAGALVLSAIPIALLESDDRRDGPTYVLIYKADVAVENFAPAHETTARAFLRPEDFLAGYSGGNRALMKRLMELCGFLSGASL